MLLLLVPASVFFSDIDNINKAIANGDAAALSRYFDDVVEIAVLDEEDMYDKAEAKTIVANFFAKHKPRSFKMAHEGVSKNEDSKYTIGNLSTVDGKTFRVYVYYSIIGNAYRIQEIRFDK